MTPCSRQRRWFLPVATAILIAVTLTSACSTTSKPTRVHQKESFAMDTPFVYYSNRDPEAACEIGKRALLSQGYQILDDRPLNPRGEKLFQPVSEHVTRLNITLVCLPSSLGAVIYANALETYYELKSQGTSAGVSVSGMGSLSLPWTSTRDTLVKIGEETITQPEFYQRFFDLIKTLDG